MHMRLSRLCEHVAWFTAAAHLLVEPAYHLLVALQLLPALLQLGPQLSIVRLQRGHFRCQAVTCMAQSSSLTLRCCQCCITCCQLLLLPDKDCLLALCLLLAQTQLSLVKQATG